MTSRTDYSPPGSSVHGFSKQEYWSGLPFPSPGDLPDPGIEFRSPALQVDTLPSEPPCFHRRQAEPSEFRHLGQVDGLAQMPWERSLEREQSI